MPMKLDFFVKLKCQRSTIILLVGIKYSMRDSFLTVSSEHIWHAGFLSLWSDGLELTV